MITEEKNNSNLESSNIFDDFELDSDTKQELEGMSDKTIKDSDYYLSKLWMILKYLNLLFFIILSLLFSYILIQQSSSDIFKQKSYLNPVCSILNWADYNSWNNCSSVKNSISFIDKELSDLSYNYVSKIAPILEKSYEIDNMKNSKESLFIVDKSLNKNDPILILNKFDRIKSDFTSVDKQMIKCEDVNIEWNIFEAKCSAFSDSWDDNIPWANWEKAVNIVSWTSITLASSFLNYLSKDKNIILLDKQKVFESSAYLWEWWYVYKTDFDIKFQYSKDNSNLDF